MAHEELVEAAKAAVNEVFGDKSVSQTDTIASLQEIGEEIEMLISAIESDLAKDDG